MKSIETKLLEMKVGEHLHFPEDGLWDAWRILGGWLYAIDGGQGRGITSQFVPFNGNDYIRYGSIMRVTEDRAKIIRALEQEVEGHPDAHAIKRVISMIANMSYD